MQANAHICSQFRVEAERAFQVSRWSQLCLYSVRPFNPDSHNHGGTHTFKRHARVPGLHTVAHGHARGESWRWADRGCGFGWGRIER
jgi:hypothetical protein